MLTEELKGFHLVWHFIARKVRTEHGFPPDAQMLASGSALLSRLLGPEGDMSTSQLRLLDDLERVVSQLQGIRQPEDFEVGDVCLVTRASPTALAPSSTVATGPPAPVLLPPDVSDC